MTPLVLQLPLDPTGVSPDNLVSGEPHELIANRTYRAIAPFQGAFFAESLIVVDAATGQTLTDGTNGTAEQYYACEYYELPSERYGKEIDAIIIVKDPNVSNNVLIDYQALGGEYGTSVQAIIQQIEALGLDNRPVAWGDIIGKPNQFPPSKHLHDVGDVYGFEYVVHALDRIRDAIEIGDQASHDAIYAYVDAAIATLQNANNQLAAQLNAHLNDFGNPHRVTAAQLSVYTKTQSDAITTPINSALTAHVNNTNNPHNTTAAQVGALTAAQSKAVTDQITANLNAHTNNLSNPHQTTVAQLNTYDAPTIENRIAAVVNANKVPYTSVQQGGGANQANNKVYLGWDGARLRCQVDGTDLQGLVATPELTANVNNLQAQINGKAPAGQPYAYDGINQSVTFFNITANGTLQSVNDIVAFVSDKRLKENIRRIPDARRKVRELMGVLYNHNALAAQLVAGLDTSRQYMGLIAQDVQKVAPEVVQAAPFDKDATTGESISGENYLTIQYEKLVALMIEAQNASDKRIDNIMEHLGLRDREAA